MIGKALIWWYHGNSRFSCRNICLAWSVRDSYNFGAAGIPKHYITILMYYSTSWHWGKNRTKAEHQLNRRCGNISHRFPHNSFLHGMNQGTKVMVTSILPYQLASHCEGITKIWKSSYEFTVYRNQKLCCINNWIMWNYWDILWFSDKIQRTVELCS